MLRLDQIKNGPKELIMMLILKSIQIFLLVNLILLIQQKELREIIDIVTHSMHKYIHNLNPLINKVIQLLEVLMNIIQNNLGKSNMKNH